MIMNQQFLRSPRWLFATLAAVLLTSCQTTPSVVGTRWSLSIDIPGERFYKHDIIFHAGGRLENHHPNDRTPDNDTWEQRGSTVILHINSDFITYTGHFQDARTLTGVARNVRGRRFVWKAERLD